MIQPLGLFGTCPDKEVEAPRGMCVCASISNVVTGVTGVHVRAAVSMQHVRAGLKLVERGGVCVRAL